MIRRVLQLAAGLLDDAVLACKDDGHAGEVDDLGAADDEGVDVEAAGGENAGHAGENARLVLHEAVEDVALRRGGRWGGRLVEDVGDGGLCGPGGRGVSRRQGRLAAAEGLVCYG